MARMGLATVAIVALLVIASGVFGYYIGAFVRVDSPNGSTNTSITNNFVPYQLSILPASWTNEYTAQSGNCGVGHMSSVNPGSGVVSEGPPEATCDVPMRADESGIITVDITNSGRATSVAFEAMSSDPSEIYFLNPQGCASPNAVGFCGYVGADTSASFNFTWVSNEGLPSPSNVTIDVLAAIMSYS